MQLDAAKLNLDFTSKNLKEKTLNTYRLIP